VKHHLQEAYLKRVRSFETLNPGAYRFLTRLEQDGPSHGLWLSTATNAHLYKDNAFLVHLQLSTSKLKPSSLLLSAQFNSMIADDTIDRSNLLVPRPLERLVMASSGFRKGWASARGGTIELKVSTPDAFYDVLMRTINTLQVHDEVAASAPA
jgi:hypothetical protein